MMAGFASPSRGALQQLLDRPVRAAPGKPSRRPDIRPGRLQSIQIEVDDLAATGAKLKNADAGSQ
jgi:hypothetical protein